MTPETGAGDFAQAMMDLGATICRPRAPDCVACPLSGHCTAFASGDPERFPGKPAKAARPVRYGIAWWTERHGCVWLVRRPAKGLLGGMAALPGDEWTDLHPPSGGPVIGTVRHVFTHFALELSIVESRGPVGEGWWQPLDRIDGAGLPTLYRKAVESVDRRRLAA